MDGVGLVPISLIAAKRQRRPATHAHTHTYVCSEGVSRHEGLTYQHAKPRQHTHKPNHKHKPPTELIPSFHAPPPQKYIELSLCRPSHLRSAKEGAACSGRAQGQRYVRAPPERRRASRRRLRPPARPRPPPARPSSLRASSFLCLSVTQSLSLRPVYR